VSDPKFFNRDPAVINALAQHVVTKWTNGCPMCGTRRWSPHAFVNMELSPSAKGQVIGAQVLPSAALVCQNCGFTAIVNLIVAGIVKPDE
jgi:hypothetical protein